MVCKNVLEKQSFGQRILMCQATKHRYILLLNTPTNSCKKAAVFGKDALFRFFLILNSTIQ